MRITRIAHATTLLQFDGITVLTDPWLSDRPGWRHSEPFTVNPAQLAGVSAVISTHAHPDHFDLAGLRRYCPPDVPLIVRQGTGDRARRAGFRRVTELDHWQSAAPVPGLKVTAAPARHSSPENTYILESGGRTLFFGGDTRLVGEFREVARRHPHIDVALPPINGVRLFGQQTVMDPYEAVEACRILSPHVAIPIHYGMAAGWKSGWMLRQPGTPEAFRDLVMEAGLPTRVVILGPGESFQVPQAAGVSVAGGETE